MVRPQRTFRMKLRPELTPPQLDEALVARLARLADRLDGARPGARDDELTEFNRLAGTAVPLADFQGIYKSENPEDFVRRVLFQRSLAPDPSLSQAEMAEIVSRVMACEENHDFYLELFIVNCKHPAGTGLIYWPSLVSELPQDREPTAEEIAGLAMRGRAYPSAQDT
jgi:hypothetical protein